MPRNIFSLLLSFGDCSGATFAFALIGEASVDAVLAAVEEAEEAKAGGPEEAEAMMRNQTIHNNVLFTEGKKRKTEEMGGWWFLGRWNL